MHPPHPPESHPAPATAYLVGGAAVAMTCGGVVFWLAGEVAEGEFQAFDDKVLVWLQHHRTEHLTSLFSSLTEFGNWKVLAILAAGIAPALWMIKRPGMAVALAGGMLGGGLISNLLKLAFARARPGVVEHLQRAHGYSFPSGHTIGSTVFFTTIALLVATHVKSGKLRTFLVGYALTIGALVATSRMYLGVHYPTDVAAGILIGVAWSLAVVFAEYRWRHGPLRLRRRHSALAASVR